MFETKELNLADDILIGTTEYYIIDLYEKIQAELKRTNNIINGEFVYLNYAYVKEVFIEDEEGFEYVEEYENYIGLEYRCSEEELEGIIEHFKKLLVEISKW